MFSAVLSKFQTVRKSSSALTDPVDLTRGDCRPPLGHGLVFYVDNCTHASKCIFPGPCRGAYYHRPVLLQMSVKCLDGGLVRPYMFNNLDAYDVVKFLNGVKAVDCICLRFYPQLGAAIL